MLNVFFWFCGRCNTGVKQLFSGGSGQDDFPGFLHEALLYFQTYLPTNNICVFAIKVVPPKFTKKIPPKELN